MTDAENPAERLFEVPLEDRVPPVFVLVRPQMGENIGGAARAMLNFGLERLRVVDPRDGWPSPKAVAMASGAGRLLETAGPYPDGAGQSGFSQPEHCAMRVVDGL